MHTYVYCASQKAEADKCVSIPAHLCKGLDNQYPIADSGNAAPKHHPQSSYAEMTRSYIATIV